jgi:hypothetical protein
MAHPATGPISPEEMARIAALPYGKAHEELRKHDPAWGLATADNPVLKWEVTLTSMVPAYTLVEVEAATEQEARKIALGTKVARSEWEVDDYGYAEDIEVDEITPVKPE